MTDERRCGTCKWWNSAHAMPVEGDAGERGICVVAVPFYVKPRNRRTFDSHGAHCKAWSKRDE